MDFETWVFKVCEHKTKFNKTAHDIFQELDLIDAKMSWRDGVAPENYK